MRELRELNEENEEPDIVPDIVIKFDCYVHKVGVYRAEVTIYAVDEEATDSGEIVRQQKEVYSFSELYEGVRLNTITRQVAIRAADWLIDNGYSGLVSLEGNAADYMTSLSGTGITKYNIGESDLYLSPYRSWGEEQNAEGGECIVYEDRDIN